MYGRLTLSFGAVLVLAVAAGLAFDGLRGTPRTAEGATGDNLRQFDAQVPFCSSGIGVGLAFDGVRLLLTCYQSNVIQRVSPTDGATLGPIAVSGVSSLGAVAWDASRQKLWACDAFSQVYLIDTTTNVGTFQFTSSGCFDGLAYDGSDDTLWASPDADVTLSHYRPDGSLIASFNLNGKIGSCGNSGIAVGGNNLYLSNNGCSQIFECSKSLTSCSLMSTFPRRLEDLECDNTTFPGKNAIWSKDAYDLTLNAWEIPLGTCNLGGTPQPPKADRDIVFIHGIDSTSSCDGADQWAKDYLKTEKDGAWVRAQANIGNVLHFNYKGGDTGCVLGVAGSTYTREDTCGGVDIAASRLKDLIDDKATSPVTIAGHSMGGLISAYMVAQNTDWAKSHVASVVTFDSPLRGLPDGDLDALTVASICERETGSIPDMQWDSEAVATAEDAANTVPFYTLDATQNDLLTYEYVLRPLASLSGARAFHANQACSKSGANQNTCEPPTSIDDDHSSAWNRPHDEHNVVDKARLMGCAVLLLLDCQQSVAKVMQGATSETNLNVEDQVDTITITSNFGSIVRMTLQDPAGNIYGPDGLGNVEAYAVDENSEVYVIKGPLPGIWIVRLTGIDVLPEGEDVSLLLGITRILLAPPIARAGGPYAGGAGDLIEFDGSASVDDGSVVSYEWDWDNDGIFDTTSGSPLVEHSFSGALDALVALRVEDDDGLMATDYARITITAPEPTVTPTPTDTATSTATHTSTPTVTATPIPVGERCADVNGNGRVDAWDVLLVLNHTWKRYDARYDLNNDGRVNLRDVLIAVHQIGRRC